MSRLTKKILLSSGECTYDFSNERVGEFLTDHKAGVRALFEELCKYEDLEEQGMLIKLPCKVGDTVYVKMQFGGYAKGEIRDFTHFVTCGFCVVVTSEKFDKINIPFSEFGKSIFLTEPQE